jgi:hypothetical protein
MREKSGAMVLAASAEAAVRIAVGNSGRRVGGVSLATSASAVADPTSSCAAAGAAATCATEPTVRRRAASLGSVRDM